MPLITNVTQQESEFKFVFWKESMNFLELSLMKVKKYYQ
jgi:hypothetical protein